MHPSSGVSVTNKTPSGAEKHQESTEPESNKTVGSIVSRWFYPIAFQTLTRWLHTVIKEGLF